MFVYHGPMGNRGKVAERERAREMRARSATLAEIAGELDVSKSSVSVWVRDVDFIPRPRQRNVVARTNKLHIAKLAQIEEMNELGREMIGVLSEDAFLAAGVALYAGEGSKTDGTVNFANTDPQMMRFFCTWLRRYFAVDESRLRVSVYLHRGLDLDAAEAHWSEVTGVPRGQFGKAYRAVPDPSIRTAKHKYGCAYTRYSCSRTHRLIMGLIRALLSEDSIPG